MLEVIQAISENLCQLSVFVLVCCVGIAIIISELKVKGRSSNNEEGDE